MPREFAMPSSETELWVPLPLYEHAAGPSWNARYLTLIGRLKPDVTAAEAAEALEPIAAAIKTRWRNNDPDDIVDLGTVVSLHEEMVGNTRPTLAALAGATALLLLVACVNIVNLLLARGLDRQRELAVRQALGAGPARLVQQLLVESVTLALAGGVVGVLAAAWPFAPSCRCCRCSSICPSRSAPTPRCWRRVWAWRSSPASPRRSARLAPDDGPGVRGAA